MNILIAEDNPIIQMINEKLMDMWGYDFDMVSNGMEVVECAQNNEGQYDLCLMDVQMPIMNGLEATRIIRQTVKYLPILAFSSSPEHKRQCFEVEVDDFVEKPCFPNRLYDKINQLTVKFIKVDISEKNLSITKETPINPQQALVLKQLKEQHLSMVSIFGASTEAIFVVNEAVPLFIEKEFAENQKQSVQFLDHNPEGKGLCRLFARTSMVVKSFMLEEDFARESQREITKLKEIIVGKK